MNEMRWNLDKLYTSFDSEEFKADFDAVDQKIEEIKKWSVKNFKDDSNATQKLEEYIKNETAFMEFVYPLFQYASLTTSVEAKNKDAQSYLEQLRIKFVALTQSSVMYEKWIGNLKNLDAIIDSSDFLKNFKFILKETAEKKKYLLSEKEEIAIAKMQQTGSTAWSTLQNNLTANLLVDIEIDGEKKQLPLPVVRNMAHDKSSDIRKKAYEAELEAYKKIEESSAACLNAIKGERLSLSKMRGYDSIIDKVLVNSRMDKETLDAMLSAMQESLPAFRKYFRKKGELLGHKDGLPFYDLFAPMGESSKNYSYQEAREFIFKNFATFSQELADFADNAFQERWIDAEPREGKRGGAFCSGIHSIKECRIMSNFSGSFSDVTTLAHELGHGFHGHCLKDVNIMNSHYPMPLAETASIFCETIINNAVLKEADEKEAFSILESTISDAAQVIVDIYSRYLFETALFEKRENSSLPVDELKKIMLQAQKDSYGKGLDENFLHPYMWANKPHYYGSDFYNFPYAFGLLFAKGLYAEYLKKGDSFVDEYKKMLKATGKNNIADTAKIMGIDVHSIDFWRASLKQIEKDIEKFINIK